ncbi:hypothetical protein [Brevundimonas naejangsanensis]|uniref:hypothetical protein n=1 Tax=Brevundimonas naejangsanensis TaxID=588932 RepID=UPI0039F6693A
MAAAPKSTAVELPPLNLQTLDIPIIGDSGLICHAWSKKARQQMLDKQMKKAAQGKAAKDPWMNFCETLYWLDGMPEKPTEDDVMNGRFGFPTVAFKSAAITAVTSTGGMTKVMARQCFHILGEYVEILGPPPSMREDMVRIAMGTADIRHRAEFETWGAILRVQHNANVLSAEQVISLFEAGGFGVGIGDWRPEKDGVSGRFHVARDGEVMPCR